MISTVVLALIAIISLRAKDKWNMEWKVECRFAEIESGV